MLVVCCGMPRSGSTLQYQFATAIIKQAKMGFNIGWIEKANCRELENPDIVKVLKVHYFEQLEGTYDGIAEGWMKCLYIYRDLRDVAVSIMRMENLSFRQLLDKHHLLNFLSEFKNWTALDHTLISRYEEVIKNPEEEVLRIAKHLGAELSSENARAISTKYSIEKQKERMTVLQKQHLEYDQNKIFHVNHIYSGMPQQWKTFLSPLQIGCIEHLAYKWLRSQNYRLSQPFYYRWIGSGFPTYFRFMDVLLDLLLKTKWKIIVPILNILSSWKRKIIQKR